MYVYLIFSFILGGILGSFLNAYIWRTRVGKSVASGRSICTLCHVQLAWFDNIPLVSYVVLKGKCRTCKKSISYQYPIVELTAGLLFLFVMWWHGPTEWPFILRDWFIVWYLLFIFVYDFLYQEIPDRASLVPAAVLFVFSVAILGNNWIDLLGAGLAGAGFFLAQYVLSKGKWIGGGDIRLGLFMGIILGWPLVLVAIFLAYIVGALIGVGLLLLQSKEMQSEIAFGTFLTGATCVTMFWGSELLMWYMNLL